MTVQELIDALSALPEEQKSFLVGCTYDDPYAWTYVHGIQGVYQWDDEEGHHAYIRLQGD